MGQSLQCLVLLQAIHSRPLSLLYRGQSGVNQGQSGVSGHWTDTEVVSPHLWRSVWLCVHDSFPDMQIGMWD